MDERGTPKDRRSFNADQIAGKALMTGPDTPQGLEFLAEAGG